MEVGSLTVNLELQGQKFNVSVKDAERTLRSFQRQLDAATGSVTKIEDVMTSATTKFRNFVMTLGMVRFALMDINDVFLRMPMNILKTSGELERLQTLMTGLSKATGDAAKASEGLKDTMNILEMAKTAPFSVKALSDAFVKLKTGGIDPSNGSLKALVDSIAKFGGNDETMHRAAIAIQQMAGKGVISMEELRQQLGEAMPNAMQTLAQAAGMSMQELISHISRGEVQSMGALNRLFAMMAIQNSGAAELMMKTWVGMLQRLQTQWQLFEKQVADSEFMQAAKIVVQDFLNVLSDPSSKGFAQGLGQALSEVVLTARDLVKNMIELADYIKLVGEGFLLYFGGSRLINGIRSVSAQFTAMMAATEARKNAEAAAVAAKIAADREAMLSEARRLQQVAANAALEIAEAKAKYATLQGLHASYIHAIEVNENLYRLNSAGRLVDDKGRFVSGATAAANNSYIAQMERVAAANQKMIEAEAAKIASLEAGVIATRRLAQEKINLGTAVEQVTAKVGKFGQFMSNLGSTILTAMGGWIGVITAALFAGALAWEHWGNQAEKAMKRVDDALQNGTANRQTQLELLELHSKKLAEIDMAIINVNNTKGDRYANARAKEDLARLQQELADIEKKMGEAQRQTVRNEAESMTRDWQRGVEDRIRATDAETNRRAAAIKEQMETDLEAAGQNFLKRQQIEKEGNKQIAEITKQGWEARLKVIREERAKVQEQIASGGTAATQRALKQELAVINEMYVRMARLNEIGGAKLGSIDLAPGREIKDPLTVAIEHAKGQLEASKARLDDLEDKAISVDNIRRAVSATIMGRARAGDFDKDDPERKGQKIHLIDQATGQVVESRKKDIETLIENTTQLEINNRARQVAVQLTRWDMTATEELADAKARLGNQGEKESTGLARLEKTMQRMKVLLSDEKMREFLGGKTWDQAKGEVLGKQAGADFFNFVGDLQAKEKDLRSGLIVDERARRESQYREEVAHLQRMFDLRVENLRKWGREEGKSNDEIEAEVSKGRKQFYEYLDLLAQKHVVDMRTPLQIMVDQWNDATKVMGEATARWADQITDAIVEFVKTGKLNFRSLVDSIITDLIRIQVRKNIVGPLSGILDGLGKKVGDVIFGGKDGTKGSLIGAATESNFATGGIMTQFGEVALRRYAAGGIANRPQLAMFGEGSRPEAYVPLPDGRSIPVTMAGGQPNVTVNVINQSGVQVQADQRGPRFDGQRMILDVVLTNVNQPGPFRDGMKNALAGA